MDACRPQARVLRRGWSLPSPAQPHDTFVGSQKTLPWAPGWRAWVVGHMPRHTVLEGARGFPSGQRGRVVPAPPLTCCGTGHCTFPQERRAEEVGDRGRELTGRTLPEPPARSVSDINECRRYPGRLCGHKCENTPGSYYCSCTMGFRLSSDGRSCEGEGRPWAGVGGRWACICSWGAGPASAPLPRAACLPAALPAGPLGNDSLAPQHVSDDVSAGAMPLKSCLSGMMALLVSPGSGECQ